MVTFSLIQGLVSHGDGYNYCSPPDLGDLELAHTGREEIAEPDFQFVTGVVY